MHTCKSRGRHNSDSAFGFMLFLQIMVGGLCIPTKSNGKANINVNIVECFKNTDFQQTLNINQIFGGSKIRKAA